MSANPSPVSLDSLIQEFLKTLKVRNLSPSHIKGVAWRLGKFLLYLAGREITEVTGITKEVIAGFQIEQYERINQMGKPNSVGHQNQMLAAVKQLTSYLKEYDYLVSDPARDIRYAKTPKSLPRGILTPTEARKILHAPDTKSVIGYRDRTILELLYSTGIRKDELIGLTLGDVDYTDGFLRVIGKGNKERVVPLGRIACRYLENYIKSVRPELLRDPYEKTVFLSQRHRPLSKNGSSGNSVGRGVEVQSSQAEQDHYFEAFRISKSTGGILNGFHLRVYSLAEGIRDSMNEIIEDLTQAGFEHLGHFHHWFQSTVGGPEVPTPPVRLCRRQALISPQTP